MLMGYMTLPEEVLLSPPTYIPILAPPLDIICLQETHSTKETEQDFLNSFQFDCGFLNGSCIKGGLLTGFKRTLDYCVHAHDIVSKDCSGSHPQALLVQCTVKQKEMVIANVYVPPTTLPNTHTEFLTKLTHEWEKFRCPNILCCGDFNMILDPEMDAAVPSGDLVFHNSAIFQSFADHSELADTFRVFNPRAKRFTHFSSRLSTSKRLDYILASGIFLNLISNVTIPPKIISDHNPVLLELEINRNPKGRGYWKFPNALLSNAEYVEWMKKQIKEAVDLNADGTPPNLLWDTIKCRIRDLTSQFLKKREFLTDSNMNLFRPLWQVYIIGGTLPSIRILGTP